MQDALDRLESVHYDCFPSGHTELTILAWWSSRMVSKRLFRVYLAYTPFIIFATVYLRYHYTVDLSGGSRPGAGSDCVGPRDVPEAVQGRSRGGSLRSSRPMDKQPLKEFVEFPYSLYRGDPFWVPPLRIAVKELLDRAKHPFYANAEAEFFLARRDGRVVGRIAAILDRTQQVSRGERRVLRILRIDERPGGGGRSAGAARKWVFDRGAVPAGAGEPLHQLRMRHAGRRLRFQSHGHDDLQPALLPGVDGKGGAAQGQGSLRLRQDAAEVELEKIGRVADRKLARAGSRSGPST